MSKTLTVAQVADILQISDLQNVRKLIHDGVLEAFDVSQPGSSRPAYRIDEAAFERFKEARMVVKPETTKPTQPLRPVPRIV